MNHPLAQFTITLLLLVGIGAAAILFVDARTTTADDIVTACAEGDHKKEICYSEQFGSYAKDNGPVAAFRMLRRVQEIDPDAIGCHFIAHGIGYGTFAQDPDNWQENFKNIDQACTYGAMHGILERHIARLPEGITQENIGSFCGADPRADCNHIIGHLTLLETSNAIPAALALCTGLAPGRQTDFCYTGVFMERVTAFNLINHGFVDESYLDWKRRLPQIRATCHEYDGAAAEACWSEMVHALVVAEDSRPAAVFAGCDRDAPSAEAARACKLHGIGVMLTSDRFGSSLARGAEMCQASGQSTDFAALCQEHIVNSFLATKPHALAEAVTYCDGRSPNAIRNACFGAIENFAAGNRSYTEADRAAACAAMPADFQRICTDMPRHDDERPTFFHPEEL